MLYPSDLRGNLKHWAQGIHLFIPLAMNFFKCSAWIWLSFLLFCILSLQVSRVTSYFSMNATYFNQLKWLCVLQLTHDDNSFPGKQLSCWAEKNGLKFAFAVLLSFRRWKKNWLCFKLQDLSVSSARPFTKIKPSQTLFHTLGKWNLSWFCFLLM